MRKNTCGPLPGLCLASCILGSTPGDAGAAPLVVRSPDGESTIELSDTDGRPDDLRLLVSRGGLRIVEIASIKVSLAGRGELSGRARLRDVRHDNVDETFSLPWGKTATVENRCARATARLTDHHGVAWEMDLVAYDDGVAYRYRLPPQTSLAAFTVTAESADFRLVGSPTLHYTALDRFTTDHEVEFRRD